MAGERHGMCESAFRVLLAKTGFLIPLSYFHIPFPNPFVINYPFLPRLHREIHDCVVFAKLGSAHHITFQFKGQNYNQVLLPSMTLLSPQLPEHCLPLV
jgi:hypothetical protein